jgi:hypothetical protein
MTNIKFDQHNARFPAGKDRAGHPLCRCCGKPVLSFDGHPIHTKCIPKHWGKHAQGVNASRCLEFGQKSRIAKRRSEIDSRKTKR